MNSWKEALPFFPRHELACKGTGVVLMDLRFAAALPALRLAWGRPLTPTSVCRTPAHNVAERGHPTSMHLTENPVRGTNGTMAADLYWSNWPDDRKLEFARLAHRMDWSVGLHSTFCHVDLRHLVGLEQRVFLYGKWHAPWPVESVR